MSRSRVKKKDGVVTKLESSQKSFKPIQALNDEQREYINLIHKNDIIICTGKAGSGKTAIASGIAAEYLYHNRIEKIVLTRPVVGAEDLGYLPGDAEKKISPYLMPLFTELNYFCDVNRLIKEDKVWINPLAYMRGCTFKNSVIIADEAQNADWTLLKLLLTRLGDGSKMIITGDITQSDLKKFSTTPNDFLRVIETVLKPLSNQGLSIGIIDLQRSVRHPLVESISQRFESVGYK